MGFESGSSSFRAFYLSRDLTPADIERFAKFALPPLDTLVGDEPLCGWAGPAHALDADLSEEHCWRGDWLWFAHVTARKKVPPSYLRAVLQQELEIERRAREVEFLPRAAKTEVRERVEEALIREAQPSFGCMECAVDLRNTRLFASAMNDAAIQTLCSAFRETSDCMPVLMGPESAAYRLRGIDCNSLEPVNMTPNNTIAAAPEIALGTEFLTWLFYRWENEDATFDFDDARCGLMFEGPLTFAGDEAPGCHETLLRNGTPLDTPEFGIALWNGKKLRRAKLTLTKNDWVVTATVDGNDFSFRSVKTDPPKKAKEKDAFDEMPSMNAPGAPVPPPAEDKHKLEMAERMDRAAFFVDAFLHLYGEFLKVREEPAAWYAQLEKIRTWVAHRAGMDAVQA